MSNHLPVTRVKTIMKSSADVETISKESLVLVTHATELFIKLLAQLAQKESNGKEIEYRDIAEVVNTSERFDFLSEIIPKKITVRQFKQILMARKQEAVSSTEEDSNEDSDTEDSDSSNSTESDANSSPEEEEPELINLDSPASSVIIIDPDTESDLQ